MILLLSILAVILNALMDEIQFHYFRLFGKIIKTGSKCEAWFNPEISWKNKYATKYGVINFLLGTVFVWATDFWHLLKTLFLTCISLIILLILFPGIVWTDYLLGLVLIAVGWGFVFELTNVILGTISDFVKNKNI